MNTNEINRIHGIFSPEEKALRELITHYEDRAKFYEAQVLKVARLTQADCFGEKASRLLSLAEQVVSSNARVKELRTQLQELEAQLDAVS